MKKYLTFLILLFVLAQVNISFGQTIENKNGVKEVACVLSVSSYAGTAGNCSNSYSGKASITVTNGTLAYDFTWTGGNISNSVVHYNTSGKDSITGYVAGSYTVIIKDTNGCTTSKTIQIPQASSPTISTNTTQIACMGQSTGKINAAPSGGTPPYTYLWSANATGNTNSTISNLAAGVYTLTVTDAGGCWSTTTAIIIQPTGTALGVSLSPYPSTCGLNNGSISVAATGGVGAYTYSWSNGQTGNIAAGLLSNTYTVTVTDNNSCTVASTALVPPSSGPTLILVPKSATCGKENGSISTSTSGGTQPYSYYWSNKMVVPDPTNLSVGIYTVTVSDANGCSFSSSTQIDSVPVPGVVIQVLTNVSCNGGSNGSLTALVFNGTSPYTYSWSGISNSNNTSAIANNLTAGTYTVAVTDANTCTITVSANISQPEKLTAKFTGSTNLLSGCNGNLSAEASGGTSPYTYSWSNYYNIPVVTNVCPGNYAVTVTDAGGCTAISNASLKLDSVNFPTPTPLVIYMNLTDASGPAVCDGTANPFVTGGTPPYQFLYSDQLITQTHQGLCPGVYSLKVTDYKGQKDSVSFVISSPKTTYVDSSKKNIALTDSVIKATLNTKAVKNCQAFNTSIDSIRIRDYNLINGTDSVDVNWYIFHKTAVDSIHQHYPISVAGVYTVILQLYCVLPIAKTEAVAGVLKGVGHVYITPEALTTGISSLANNLKNPAALVFPNPFNSTVTIQFSGQSKYAIQVYDITGNKVMENVNGNSTISNQILDLSKLKAGTYLLNIVTPTAVEYHKLVKAN